MAHPDRFASSPSDGLAALQQTQIINAAYQLLDAEAQYQATREPGWNGAPIRTVGSGWWPMRALASNTASAAEGALIFLLVWALLAGTAVGVDKLILR